MCVDLPGRSSLQVLQVVPDLISLEFSLADHLVDSVQLLQPVRKSGL